MTEERQLASFLRFSYQDLIACDPDQVSDLILRHTSEQDREELAGGLADILFDLSVSLREWSQSR